MLTQIEAEFNLSDKLLTPGDFHPYPDIRDRAAWEDLPDIKKQKIIEEAKRFQKFKWPGLLATDFMSFYRTGNRKSYEDPHFLRRHALISLVLGECVEAKGHFMDDIINGIWAICEESFWGISAHNGKLAFTTGLLAKQPLPDIEEPFLDLFAAETGNLLAWTSYLLHSSLNEIAPQICRRISLELERRIKSPFIHHNDTNWMGYISTNKVNNWNPWITSNVLNVFLLTEHDSFRRSFALKKMFEVLDSFLDTYGKDGGCDEGTTYWSHAGGSLHDFCDRLFSASKGEINLFELPLIQEIGRFIYKEHISGPYFINFADGDAKTAYNRALIYHYGLRIADQRLMDLAVYLPDYISDEPENPPTSIHRRLCELFDCKGLYENNMTNPPQLRDMWLPDIQVAAARQLEASDKGLYLAAKAGHNDESHNHNDVGNFIIYLDGNPGIIDVGVGVYTQKTFSENRYELWNVQSSYHNLPSVNKTQQGFGCNYRAKDIHYLTNNNFMELTMEIGSAYPTDSGLNSLKRRFYFDRLLSSITIEDTFSFNKKKNSLSEFLICKNKPLQIDSQTLKIPVYADNGLEIKYDSSYSVSIEEIKIEDRRLQKSWGNVIYRICFSALNLPGETVFSLVINRLP